jgi:acetoacetate decarboxylase
MATEEYSQFDPHAGDANCYSIPTMSPLYSPPPFEYRDGWTQHIMFRSDPAVIARHVPKPLTIDPQGRMTMTISRFFATGFGAYHEAVLSAFVTLDGHAANFTLYLLLDSDVAVGGGREIWGWPKKIGRVGLTTGDGMVTATAERGGAELVRATVEIGSIVPASALANGSPDFYNLKLIPSVKNGARPEVMQLTKSGLTNFVPKQVYSGRATLTFGSSAVDRFDQFPVHEIVKAFYYNSDFTLGDGEVVYDYQK